MNYSLDTVVGWDIDGARRNSRKKMYSIFQKDGASLKLLFFVFFLRSMYGCMYVFPTCYR